MLVMVHVRCVERAHACVLRGVCVCGRCVCVCVCVCVPICSHAQDLGTPFSNPLPPAHVVVGSSSSSSFSSNSSSSSSSSPKP